MLVCAAVLVLLQLMRADALPLRPPRLPKCIARCAATCTSRNDKWAQVAGIAACNRPLKRLSPPAVARAHAPHADMTTTSTWTRSPAAPSSASMLEGVVSAVQLVQKPGDVGGAWKAEAPAVGTGPMMSVVAKMTSARAMRAIHMTYAWL